MKTLRLFVVTFPIVSHWHCPALSFLVGTIISGLILNLR